MTFFQIIRKLCLFSPRGETPKLNPARELNLTENNRCILRKALADFHKMTYVGNDSICSDTHELLSEFAKKYNGEWASSSRLFWRAGVITKFVFKSEEECTAFILTWL